MTTWDQKFFALCEHIATWSKDKSNGKIWAVNASGDGDFRHHKVEFEFIH